MHAARHDVKKLTSLLCYITFVKRVIDAAIAAAMLVIADVAVRVLPFSVIARRVERPLRRANGEDESIAKNVRWAIDAAHRRLPWKVPCLATAVAANRLLAWRGVASELWLGVRANEKLSVDAHAWLVANGRVIAGEAEHGDYTPMHSLVTRHLSS